MAAKLISHLKLWLNRIIVADGRQHQKKGCHEEKPEQSHETRVFPLEHECELWHEEIGSQLADMMEMAEYPTSSQTLHAEFFLNSVTPFLGYHPRGKAPLPHLWKSFMTDDHTPIELSWAWSSGPKRTPAVRYSVEPISRSAYRGLDAENLEANVRMLGESLRLAPDLDLCLHRHLGKALAVTHRKDAAFEDQETQSTAAYPGAPQSQCFIAFDLHENNIVVKQYYIPHRRSRELGCDNWSLIRETILKIPVAWIQTVEPALTCLTNFIGSCEAATMPSMEIMSIDCVDPVQSRLKIYCRSRETSFNSVLKMLSLGGRKPLQPEEEENLWDLWLAIFGLTRETYSSWDQPLSGSEHRTSGILYYYELRGNKPCPNSKVYLPVRHYAQNDDQIARGLSDYLEERGKGLGSGSYYEAVQKLCKHRSLASGLGFHTYISWAGDKGKWNITAYFNPQIYSR